MTAAPPPRKAGAVDLSPDATASEAFAAIVEECREQWQTNEAALLVHRNVDSLHQARVGLRRLRSAWSLFRPWFGDVPGYAAAAQRLREHIVPLGPARDLDVLLGGDLVAHLDEDQVARLRAAREAAYDVVVADLTSPSWQEITRELLDLVAARPWGLAQDPPARDVAAAALTKRWGRVCRRGADLASMTPEARHRVRIEAKKVRYGSQFFSDLFPEQPEGVLAPWDLAEEVARLQDDLGLLNDAAVAADLLASVGAPAPPVDEAAMIAQAQHTWREVTALTPFWVGAGRSPASV